MREPKPRPKMALDVVATLSCTQCVTVLRSYVNRAWPGSTWPPLYGEITRALDPMITDADKLYAQHVCARSGTSSPASDSTPNDSNGP